MDILDTDIPEVKILVPRIFADNRGFFLESWNPRALSALGLDLNFVQDNHSRSSRGTLRGLHYQIEHPQGKLVRTSFGRVFDVAVDIRRSSPTFGQWVGAELSDDNHHMLWVPPGFAHGFYVMSEMADFQYKCTDFYYPQHDRAIRWNDPDLAIDWPLEAGGQPLVSEKDGIAPRLADAEVFSSVTAANPHL